MKYAIHHPWQMCLLKNHNYSEVHLRWSIDFVGNIRKVVFLILCLLAFCVMRARSTQKVPTLSNWEEESTFKCLSVIISLVNIINNAEWLFKFMSVWFGIINLLFLLRKFLTIDTYAGPVDLYLQGTNTVTHEGCLKTYVK